MRRGIKEMDLILSRFAEAHLADMDDAALAAYDALLDANDQDLLLWVTGRATAPARLQAVVGEISRVMAKPQNPV